MEDPLGNNELTLMPPSVAIYVIGRSKGLRGKLCTTVLVLIHAFFSALVASLITDARHNSLMGALVEGIVMMMHYIISPLALTMQIMSQYRELQRKDNLGALSLRSFALQAAVMFVLALRLIFKLGGWPSLDHSKHNNSTYVWEDAAMWKFVLGYALAMWQMDHVSWNYICWVGGAVFVWYKTVYPRDLKGRGVELEGLLE